MAAIGSGVATPPTNLTADATASAAGPSGDEKKVMESVSDPEFRLAVEVLYHGARRAFFIGTHRWAMFATIIFGASAASAFMPAAVCGLLAAATSAADIAFDLTGRAQAHGDIRRRYLDLAAKLAQGADPAPQNFAVEWMGISADEPPLYRWVEITAHRNACIALDRELPPPLKLWQRLVAHFWRG